MDPDINYDTLSTQEIVGSLTKAEVRRCVRGKGMESKMFRKWVVLYRSSYYYLSTCHSFFTMRHCREVLLEETELYV